MERLVELASFLVAAFSGLFGLFVQDLVYIAIPPPPVSPHTEVLFVGDMMFDRSIREAMEANGSDYVFSCINTVLGEADFVVGNLEGPITPYPSKSVGSVVGSHDNFVFTFPEYVAPLLHRHNIRAVSLGNNHILNFDREGVSATTQALHDADVGYFGEPVGHSVSEINSNGIALSLIGFNEFDSGWTASTTVQQIMDARATGRIPVVFAHWGDEYLPANDLEKTLAHRFIDSGAEFIIGAHPHVIQEHELYKGKHIYYSLGNFIFDQYWNDAVTTGLIVRVSLDTAGVLEMKESRVDLRHDRRTCLIAK